LTHSPIHSFTHSPKSLIVIGGGAAGFFCAVNAARLHPGMKVILLEKTSKLLSKVKVSGGGRCNVTHACFSIAEMIKRYPRGGNFVKKTFHHFFTTDTVEWFKQRGVTLKTEADGRMFPITNNSQTIIDCLVAEANKYNVEIRMNAAVESFSHSNDKFEISLSGGRSLQADLLCIACGGYPKSAQFDWLTQSGHTIQSPVPSLFTFNLPGHNITSLMGIAVPETTVKIIGTKLQQSGPLLITHWGMSGPAILKTSAWAARILAEKNYERKISAAAF
jgi:predicted Rossmann fold flavoprotein